jgi:formylglycine-generating enzyme required for sulfatase activity
VTNKPSRKKSGLSTQVIVAIIGLVGVCIATIGTIIVGALPEIKDWINLGNTPTELTFRVTDISGASVSQAKLILLVRNVALPPQYTDSSGFAKFSVNDTKDLRVFVESSQYEIFDLIISGNISNIIEIRLKQKDVSKRSVIVRVLDSEKNEPVDGAKVVLIANGNVYSQSSDSNGITKFVIGFPTDEIDGDISVSFSGFNIEHQRVTLQADRVQDINLNKVAGNLTVSFTDIQEPFVIPTPTDTSGKIGIEIDWVNIPAGEFIMGSNPDEPYFFGAESPRHKVFLDEYWIQRTEVTNKLYRLCVEAGACHPPREIKSSTRDDYYTNSAYDDFPVIYVSYNDASSFCKWVGGKLPTEAEWEKAARGTDGRLFPWGNGDLAANLANFCDTGCPHPGEAELNFDDGYRDTAPVGSYPAGASPYGILDMAGNVLEWTSDWYSTNYYAISPYKDPLGSSTGTKHPIRGGSWYSARAGLRTSARASLSPDSIYDTVGFRCAK